MRAAEVSGVRPPNSPHPTTHYSLSYPRRKGISVMNSGRSIYCIHFCFVCMFTIY